MQPANYRNADPVTSRLAGEEVVASGQSARQQQTYLALVHQHPGKTSRELAFILQQDRYIAARRLPELEQMGKVMKGMARQCSVGGKLSVTWWPYQAQMVLL